MINFNDVTKENKRAEFKLASNPDHPNKILIIGGFGYGKANLLFNLIITNPFLLKLNYMLKFRMKQVINC